LTEVIAIGGTINMGGATGLKVGGGTFVCKQKELNKFKPFTFFKVGGSKINNQ